jgi:hypothetical protein
MKTTIDLFPQGVIDAAFSAKVRRWAEEVFEQNQTLLTPDRIAIHLWEKEKDFQEFDVREKAELGITTAGESEFLATHEAWRGFPRIHVSLEKIRVLNEGVIQGLVQHEVAHALLHGRPEFYQFRFSETLLNAGRSAGLDFPLLQQLVYLLAVAVKDEEVVRFLAEGGLGPEQIRLLEYLLEDTEEERKTWELIRDDPVLRLLGLAAFLKIRLPLEVLAGVHLPGAPLLLEKWQTAYAWLTPLGREELNRWVHKVLEIREAVFQDRLNQTVEAVFR